MVLIAVIAVSLGDAGAAKKKSAPPSPAKPIYDAPMRVFIVRNSDPRCEPNCPQWIGAEGQIMRNTPALFKSVFKQMGKYKLPIIIRSPGGSIEAALEIGRMIRDRGLTVAVAHTNFRGCSPADSTCKPPKDSKGIYEGTISEEYAFCNSACPMIVSGGTTRMISYLASAGVHQPSTTWTREVVRYREFYKIVKGKKKVTERKILSRKNVPGKTTYGLDDRLRKKLGAYYKSMGVDLAILDETNKAKFTEMNYLSADQADKLKLRTVPLRAVYLDGFRLCGASPTSAVCVLDKSRDPAIVRERLYAMAGIAPNSPAMTFRLAQAKGSDCETLCFAWIAAEGVITETTPHAFEIFLKTAGVKSLPIVFNSPGGDVKAAMELGKAIRRLELQTTVGQSLFEKPSPNLRVDFTKPAPAEIKSEGTCHGVCLLAFAGGKSRHVSKGTQIALHNPAIYRDIAGSTSDVIAMNYFLYQMGVSNELMTSLYKVDKTKPKQFKYEELLHYVVATGARDFSESSVDLCERNPQATGCYSTTVKPVEPKKQVVAPLPVEDKRFAKMTFTHFRMSDASCEPLCPSWLYAQGRIEKGSFQEFKKSLSGHTLDHLMVMFDSPGGDEAEALNMGRFISQSGMHTTIGVTIPNSCLATGKPCAKPRAEISKVSAGLCNGECVWLFVAGTERILTNDTVLSPSVLVNADADRIFAIKDYLRDVSASNYLITAMRGKSWYNNRNLKADDARRQNVASQNVSSLSQIVFAPTGCKSAPELHYCR
jgi:hypothetical protein